MNMSTTPKRRYSSTRRTQSALATKQSILAAARTLFAEHGIDKVTIGSIGEKAGVAESTVYALFKSKEGILRGIMQASLFGERFKDAQSQLEGVTDAVELIRLTSHVSRAIYENESTELGLLRGTSSFSSELKKLEQEFENMRYAMQKDRLQLLFQQSKAKPGLSFEDARQLLWMYTSREIYRMLVIEGKWSPSRYQDWLSGVLVATLVAEL